MLEPTVNVFSIFHLIIGNEQSYGITIDHRVLEASDDTSIDPTDITFTVAVPPSYGQLTWVSRIKNISCWIFKVCVIN